MKINNISYCIAWICSAVAVIAGFYFINSTWCILGMFAPIFIDRSGENEEDNVSKAETSDKRLRSGDENKGSC